MEKGVTLTPPLHNALFSALDEALKRRHEYMTLEHLLYAMAHEPEARVMLRALSVDLRQLTAELDHFFTESIDPLPAGVDAQPMQTPMLERVLQRAATHVRSSGREAIDSGDVLAAFFREPASHAVYLLEKQGVTRLDVLQYVSHGIRKSQDEAPPDPSAYGFDEDDDDLDILTVAALDTFAVNLTERAADGLIDPLIGRDAEVERMVHVLSRRRKNNPILVGDPGVGKTAIVEGLAKRIVQGKVPAGLKGARIFSLDLGALVAGTRFRGEFEARLKAVLAEIDEHDNAILFIDEIHTIYGAGATGNGGLDASNMLKPSLSDGSLRCIGSTTFNDYKNVFEKDRALARRFQKIDILEPSVEDTVKILRGLKQRYQAHHKVTYTADSLQAAAELAAVHINESLLPDKAIDVIDEAGAYVRVQNGSKRDLKVTVGDIEAVVSRIARIPARSVSTSDRDRLALLDDELKRVIFGQDEAIENVVASIKLSRSGLGAPEKPVGSFLFSGPTGVGKTELARQLAAVLGVEFIRFDMSEYMEKHTVSRLIGAPPGYVGFDQGGLLTDAIRKTPHAVLVLDEIEKAHEDVFNILLQVMDHATLTDNNGRKADFRNVILVMTTNAGAQELTREAIGFGGAAASGRRDKAAIERTFSPEFRNRLDAWITFSSLDTATIDRVVEKFIAQTAAQLQAKNVQLEVSEAARVWLREKGYDKQYGARSMGRVIQNELKRPLADAILFGPLAKGGKARVALRKDENGEQRLALSFTPSRRRASQPAEA